jgi:hypothetical protein
MGFESYLRNVTMMVFISATMSFALTPVRG